MYENDFCEYAVEKKKCGGYLAKIILVMLLGVVLIAGSVLFLLPTMGVAGFVVIAVTAAVLWYLSRYLTIEYEYSLSGEYMDFAAIFSKQYRKEKLSVELKKEARRVMPYDGKIEGFNVSSILDMRSSADAPHSYVLVYEKNECECAVLFDANKKIVDNMFRQIPSLVVRDNNLP